MKGYVKFFLPTKSYGFIVGEDKKDYFFHTSNFEDQSTVGNVCEGVEVSFIESATPKGYEARKCVILNPVADQLFIEPDNVLTSKGSSIKGWEVVEEPEFWLHGTCTKSSPEVAKQDLIDSAKRVGATGLLNVEYYRGTGNSGNYQFTIHYYRGRAVRLAKRHRNGTLEIDELKGLNHDIAVYKNGLIDKKRKAWQKRLILWAVLLVAPLLLMQPLLYVLSAIIAYFKGFPDKYDWWITSSK